MHRVCWYAPFAHVPSQGGHASGRTCTIPTRSLLSRSFYQIQNTTHSHSPRPFPSTSWRAGPGACSMRGQPVPPHPFGRPRHFWKAGRDTQECRPPSSRHYIRITASSSSSRATHGEQDRAPRDHGPTAQQGLPPPRALLRGPGLYRTMTDGRRHGRSGLLARATGVDGKQTVTAAAGEVSQGANLAATTSRLAPT